MSRIRALFEEYGQSPWIDNLRRSWLTSGELVRRREEGIRGLTSNPTIFHKAFAGSPAYDDQLSRLAADGASPSEAYWSVVLDDIRGALDVFGEVYETSGGTDGFVSLEVAPSLAYDADATYAAATDVWHLVGRPNLMVKVPGTKPGVEAFRRLVVAGCNINVTLLFSVERYQAVAEAYLEGLEQRDGDLSSIASVASFFVSRVDTEVDRRLAALDRDEALALQGTAAVAQAKLAYRVFGEVFAGPRWEALVARGARPQRLLWASTSTKNPAYPDTLYVDELIGPATVNTLPEATIDAFTDHGRLARTVDADVDRAAEDWAALAAVGVDTDDVGRLLEEQGVASFQQSWDDLHTDLAAKLGDLARSR